MNAAETNDDAKTERVAEAVVPVDAADDAALRVGQLRGFTVGRFRISHQRTHKTGGWGHEEPGEVLVQNHFSLTSLHQFGQHHGYRLIVGSHTIWAFHR